MLYHRDMRKTPYERQKDFKRRKKLKESGHKHIELWVLPETVKLLRWAIRDKVRILKPRKDVVDNAQVVMKQLEDVEEK